MLPYPLSEIFNLNAVNFTGKPSEQDTYRRELLWNQLWQGLNFGSKAAFLILLTPLMLSRWGTAGYGVFALASSLLVSMALLDGGVRALTRIKMADAWKRRDSESMEQVYSEGLLTFASVSLIAVAVFAILSRSGCLTAWFHLPPDGSGVLVMTALCTAVLMTSILALEPLAAEGNLSTLKASNTLGALAAIPACALLVYLGGGVEPVIITYAACMTLPNVVVAYRHDLFAMIPWRTLRSFTPLTAFRTLRSGFWYYLTTISLIGKTHALTFLVSAIAGPGEAGIFYILLRFSEMISNVASTSSETSLAALTAATETEKRRACFTQSWQHVALFSIQGALIFLFMTGQLLTLWLHGEISLTPWIGLGLAIFGLTGSFSRAVVNTSMGLGLTRYAATAGFGEAILGILGAYAGYHVAGLSGLLLGGSLGALCLLPVIRKISMACVSSCAKTAKRSDVILWILPLKPLLPGIFGSAIILWGSSLNGSLPCLLGVSLSVLITLLGLKRLHSPSSGTSS